MPANGRRLRWGNRWPAQREPQSALGSAVQGAHGRRRRFLWAEVECFWGSAVSTSSAGDSSAPELPSDTVACAIDVCHTLDSEGLQKAYGRIAEAKRLKKAPMPKGSEPQTTVTLGIILAAKASVPLETLADELDRLNRLTPSAQWPNMVVVSTAGVINYAAHFPSEHVLNDLLPPAEGALASYVPPIYIVMVVRPTREDNLQQDVRIPDRTSCDLFSRSSNSRLGQGSERPFQRRGSP